MAGYSATPLLRKLGIGENSTLALLRAPIGVLGELPPGVRTKTQARGRADVVVSFFTARRQLEQSLDSLGPMIFPEGGLWIAWPKRTSGVETDLSDNVIRDVVLPLGLVDNKVCAINATWSGLRFVWRRDRRGDRMSEPAGSE